jgi:hypothetical protein
MCSASQLVTCINGEPVRTTAQPAFGFTIGRVCICLGNRDHVGHSSFAEGCVVVGPFRFTAYLHDSGCVSLPQALRDEPLRLAIAVELRRRVLAECERRWSAVTKLERQRVAA